MADLVTMEVSGRPAKVAFMAPDMDGELVAPDEAVVAIVRFTDEAGGMLYLMADLEAMGNGEDGKN